MAVSFVWIGIVLAVSLAVAGATAYLLLQALFRAISAPQAQQARSED